MDKLESFRQKSAMNLVNYAIKTNRNITTEELMSMLHHAKLGGVLDYGQIDYYRQISLEDKSKKSCTTDNGYELGMYEAINKLEELRND